MLPLRDATATVALSVALLILLGPLLARYGAVGLAVAQVACFAAPAILVSRTRTGGLQALGLVPAPTTAIVAAALVGASMWIWVVHHIAPIGAEWSSPEHAQELEAVFALPSRPLWLSILYFAVLPAICEELLHRGMLLPALCRKLGAPAGMASGAVFFGLSHLSLDRLLPTAALGLAAGFVRYRSGSLMPAVALHGIYNASLLSAAHSGWSPATSLALPALGISAIGIGLTWKVSQALNNPHA